ncbi:MAG: hypothetical protein AAF391_10655 [Bacteroidota bacterium]
MRTITLLILVFMGYTANAQTQKETYVIRSVAQLQPVDAKPAVDLVRSLTDEQTSVTYNHSKGEITVIGQDFDMADICSKLEAMNLFFAIEHGQRDAFNAREKVKERYIQNHEEAYAKSMVNDTIVISQEQFNAFSDQKKARIEQSQNVVIK